MIFWTCEKIGGHVNLTWSHVRRTCRNFSLFLSLHTKQKDSNTPIAWMMMNDKFGTMASIMDVNRHMKFEPNWRWSGFWVIDLIWNRSEADCNEAIWCKLVTGHSTVTIGVVYRCPNITKQNNEKIHNAITEVSKGDYYNGRFLPWEY